MKGLIRSIAFAAAAALVGAPASATSEHTYGKNEYVIIDAGLSPDKRLSLSAHEGEEGFHVWLMREPAHRKIAVLDDISSGNGQRSGNILDTGAGAYYATWSPDSRNVSVAFRYGRHEMQLNLYAIEKGKAYLVSGPGLFTKVAGRDLSRQDDDVRLRVPGIEWRGPRRFLLKEHILFMAPDPALAGSLGDYGKQTKLEDGQTMVEFSAEADCVIEADNRYRIVKLKPGKFDER